MFAVLSVAISVQATPRKVKPDEVPESEKDTPMKQFADSLRRIVESYHKATTDHDANGNDVCLSPYFYQMVSPGTLYSDPVKQAFGVNWMSKDTKVPNNRIVGENEISDTELVRLFYSNQTLSTMYTVLPGLFSTTQKDISNSGSIINNLDVPIKTETKLHDEVQLAVLDEEPIEQVEAILRRPNFWKFKGSNSLNLTQNYATDNWFQGKANHYNVQGIVNVEANYNNQRKLQWDNRLDLQLGFQTNSENDQNKFKPTNNLMRINSKMGLQAAKNWFYTFNVKAETQLVPNYQYNKAKDADGVEYMQRTTITDFLSPLNMDFSVGIDWKLNKKRFSSSLVLSPCTYNLKYVDRLDLSTRYGLDAGKHTKHTFGPSSTFKFNWKIADNIKWDSRLYWISNLHYVNVEFENTITFSINKYLTSKFYFYPRFNDQSKRNRMPDKDGKNTGTYWMFKEWLSLGVSYDW